jgi:hypothetical protein
MKIFKYGQFVNEADLFTGSGIEGYDSNKIGIAAKTQFCRNVANLKSWIYKNDGLGFQSAVEEILSSMSEVIDFNKDPKYQIPLKYLKDTGRFDNKSDFKFIDKLPDGTYYAKSISNFNQVLDSNGNYDPVNKLNTNYSDLAELIFDIISKEDTSIISKSLKLDDKSLKVELSNFFSGKNLVELINKNVSDIRYYVSNNRRMSSIGDNVEVFVKNKFESIEKNGEKVYKCVYQGGDGDPVDMVYGVDLIIEKLSSDEFKLVQVKSSPMVAKSSSTEWRYSNIDLFCSKIGDKVIIYTKKDQEGKTF